MNINLNTLIESARRRSNSTEIPDKRQLAHFQSNLAKMGYHRHNPAVYDAIVNYFCRESHRGFALLGEKGIGKTMGLYCAAAHFQINFVTASELAAAYANNGNTELAALAYSHKIGHSWDIAADLIIDEIGVEPCPVFHFGSPLNVIEEVVRCRYSHWQRHGSRTIFSGNLPLRSNKPGIATIETMYGDYIADRIQEMCEIPAIPGKNLRYFNGQSDIL